MKKLEEQVFDELLGEFKRKSVIAKTFGLSAAAVTKWSKNGSSWETSLPSARVPTFQSLEKIQIGENYGDL